MRDWRGVMMCEDRLALRLGPGKHGYTKKLALHVPGIGTWYESSVWVWHVPPLVTVKLEKY